MFCKVCFDAGFSNYNTHWLKDPAGNTLCPYLSNIKCRRCNYFGHTPKHCKTILTQKSYHQISAPNSPTLSSSSSISFDKDKENIYEHLAIEELPLCRDVQTQTDFEDFQTFQTFQIGKYSLKGRSWADIVGDC